MINDTAGEVKLVLDKKLLDAQFVNCHPLQNDKTVALNPNDLLKFVRHFKHEPVLVDFDAPVADAPVEAEEKKQPAEKKEKPHAAPTSHEHEDKELIGITVGKSENFGEWYTQVIKKSEMIDYYDISGCYILRPWSFAIWESIRDYLDAKIKSIGVQNCYFPMFVSERALNAEKEHVEGFAPEVAWVTKSGQSDLEEPIAVRPTSETIMYPAYANWIKSHRDLPLKLNQWANVVRWEFKQPTPFLRTREFLWQEGHTAHATEEEAGKEVLQILDFYESVYQDLLAIPVIKGRKTEMEKFAGGYYTTTVEAFIPATGRGIQGATSHCLGQNFGKMFKIEFEDQNHQKSIPWQNSWGLTTRTIGVMVMIHSDDKGLVLPPRVAPVQVVLVPIVYKETSAEKMLHHGQDIIQQLKAKGIRAEIDARTNYTPGWKYNHWELKGVPLRLELGPRDMENNQVRVVRRDNGAKEDVKLDKLAERINQLLQEIQAGLFQKAKHDREGRMIKVHEWKDFVPALNKNSMVLTPFCNETEWEEKVKKKSKEEALNLLGQQEDARTSTSAAAKTLCIPFDQPPLPEGTQCFISGKPAKCWVLWGRSY